MEKWKEIDISARDALALAADYIGDRWSALAECDVKLSVQPGGWSSRLYRLEDLTATGDDTKNYRSPSKILVRLLGGRFAFRMQRAVDHLIYYRVGKLHLGPKVYGIFDGGRLEEYIPSRTQSNDDLQRPQFHVEFARKLARFHSLVTDLPVERKARDNFKDIQQNFIKFDTEEGRAKFTKFASAGDADASWALNFDWQSELKWLRETAPRVDGPVVFSLIDVHRLNCLIRDEPDVFGETVTLIDYERSGYDRRGFDLATHLNCWTNDMNKADWKSGIDYPSDAIRRRYCEEYLKMCKELAGEVTLELESSELDAFVREVAFCSLIHLLWSVSGVVTEKSDELLPVAGVYVNFFKFLFEMYKSQKSHFVQL